MIFLIGNYYSNIVQGVTTVSDTRFLKRWEKSRKKGLAFYLAGYVITLPLACVFTKMICEYVIYKDLFRPFRIGDYIGLLLFIILCLLLGLRNWNHSERRYNAQMDAVNK